jgi:hypothetical protein
MPGKAAAALVSTGDLDRCSAGRHLGHRAVAERCVVVIAPGTLRIERALPWR